MLKTPEQKSYWGTACRMAEMLSKNTKVKKWVLKYMIYSINDESGEESGGDKVFKNNCSTFKTKVNILKVRHS